MPPASPRCSPAPRSSATSTLPRTMTRPGEAGVDGWLVIDKPYGMSSARAVALAPGPDHADFAAVVGEGTYIRALARDLAETLGTVGHIAELRRLAVGRFAESQAISLDSAVALGHSLAASEHLLPIETALDDIPALALSAAAAERLRHGQRVIPQDRQGAAIADGTIVGAWL